MHARKPVKTNSSCRALATCKLQTSFSPLVQTDNHVVQKFDTRKIYKLSNEVIFSAPFFVCFALFAFKLDATAMLNFVLMHSAFCRGVVSDTSSKCIDREGLGRRRTGQCKGPPIQGKHGMYRSTVYISLFSDSGETGH